MLALSCVVPTDRFIATRQGEVVLVADTLTSLIQEVEKRRLDARTLVIEHTDPPARRRVF